MATSNRTLPVDRFSTVPSSHGKFQNGGVWPLLRVVDHQDLVYVGSDVQVDDIHGVESGSRRRTTASDVLDGEKLREPAPADQRCHAAPCCTLKIDGPR